MDNCYNSGFANRSVTLGTNLISLHLKASRFIVAASRSLLIDSTTVSRPPSVVTLSKGSLVLVFRSHAASMKEATDDQEASEIIPPISC